MNYSNFPRWNWKHSSCPTRPFFSGSPHSDPHSRGTLIYRRTAIFHHHRHIEQHPPPLLWLNNNFLPTVQRRVFSILFTLNYLFSFANPPPPPHVSRLESRVPNVRLPHEYGKLPPPRVIYEPFPCRRKIAAI